MSVGLEEFLYKLPGTPGGVRPGAHRSRSIGPGFAIAGHRRLFDQPDPRRVDIRASVASVPREWLVRTHRQRSALAIQAIVDVSASMFAGAAGSGADIASRGGEDSGTGVGGDDGPDRSAGEAHDGKFGIVRSFVASLAFSAFRSGDAVGLSAFDALERDDLYRQPRSGRGTGAGLLEALSHCRAGAARSGDIEGLSACADRLGGRAALVFIVSDFHFALDSLPRVLERFGGALVVPLVLRVTAELEPPAGTGWIAMRDAETGRRRQVWLRASSRERWRRRLEERELEIDARFAERDIRPFRIEGSFDAERLSRHFLEHVG